MRRASVVGPLILIGLGGVLLINNMRPDLSLWGVLAQYWPYLLILWGILRVFEITAWALNNKPLPTNGVSGGEWVLIFFLTSIGTSTLYVNRNPLTFSRFPIEVFGESYDYSLNAVKAVGATPRIRIYNMRGDTHITGADVQEVRVTGSKTVRSLDKTRADQADQQTPVEVDVKGDQVFIRAKEYRAGSNGQVSYDLQITVPRGATVEGHGGKGDFDVNDLAGGVEIQSDNAGVRMQNIGGDVKVDTGRSDMIRVVNGRGSVELKGRGEDVELDTIAGQVTIDGRYGGEIECRKLAKPLQIRDDIGELRAVAVPGKVKMTRKNLSASDLTGPVVITARALDISMGSFTQSLDINVQRGDLDIRPTQMPLAKVDAKTSYGRIDLALPDNAKFELNAKTDRGEIENEFGVPLNQEETGKKSATLRGSVGQGPAITIYTVKGDIGVHKGSAPKDEESSDGPEAPVAPKAPKAAKAPKSTEQ